MTQPAPHSPVVDLCRAFVRIPSLSGQEGEMARAATEAMSALGFEVNTDACGSVLGVRRGSGPGPTVLLDAHMDTVPVTRPEAWTHAPHGAELVEGRIWGRGAADTKGSLAAMLHAVAGLEDFVGTVVVSASVGEEDLTSAALEPILDRYRPDLVLVGEPTSLRLGVAQKGRAGILLEATGRSAHSSRPELGDNAVYKLLEAVARLRALPLPVDADLGAGVCELIEIGSEPRQSQGMVPLLCTARLALRLLPGETAETVLARITAALIGLEGVSVRLARLARPCHTGHPIEMDEFIPAWKNSDTNLQGRLLAALGTTAFAAPYTTNASAAAQRGIPVFLLGPGAIEQAHISDEWLAVEELEAAVPAYAAAIRMGLGLEPR